MARSKRKVGRRWALQDAKNKLSEVVKAAESGEPQIVTRRGVEAAVVISHDEFVDLLEPAAAHGSLASCLLAMPVSEEKGTFDRIEIPHRALDG